MEWRATLFSIIFVLLHVTHQTSGDCNVTTFSSQIDALLAEYDRDSLPQTPFTVEVALDLQHVTIYEKESTVHLLIDLELKWTDPRLSWDAEDWGCDVSQVPAERLWLPDVTLLNSAASSSVNRDGMLRARLTSDGLLYWITKMDLMVPIALDLNLWPHDQQTCVLQFGSRMYNISELELTTRESRLTIWTTGAWHIISVTGDLRQWKREDEQRSVVAYTLKLGRNAAAHEFVTGAVFVTTMLLLVTAGLLPPADRASLCACAALVSSIWLITTLLRLPPAGTTPLAMRLMCVLCACGGLACSLAALTSRVARRSTLPPYHLRTLLTAASRFFKLTPHSVTSSAESGAWVAAAQLLDYVIIVLFALTFFVLICIYAAYR